MRQFAHKFHPDLPESFLWGYVDLTSGTPKAGHLGPVIVARRGRPVQITFLNELPDQHILPIDTTLMGSEPGQAANRVAPHLHGGLVAPDSDGGPLSWFTPNPAMSNLFSHGPDWVPGDYVYPNNQSARMMWYHDHALGITRLNAYAGLASAYILRDDIENVLIGRGVLPSGEFEIPLVLQDRTFQPTGRLWYPEVYEPDQDPTGRWAYAPNEEPSGTVSGPLPRPSVVPEFFGDTPVVNGAAYPYLNVKPRRYRFRILNGSQARFYNLQLYYEGEPGEANLSRPGPAMLQIGTEGGFLPVPVVLNNPPKQIAFDMNPTSPTAGNAIRYTLLLAPAERADVIIDFSRTRPGDRLILYNDAPSPFPGGDERHDYFTGGPDLSSTGGAPPTTPLFGPNTRTLLQFRVTGTASATSTEFAGDPAGFASSLSSYFDPASAALSASAAGRVRDITLNEDFDDFGRLLQRCGTNTVSGQNSQGLPTFGRNFHDAATETPRAGDTEIWRIFNLSMDTHPIHFHLVNARVLGRQPFDPITYNGTPRFTGPFRGPDANELGAKETIRMNPMEMTSVLMKFDVPPGSRVNPRTGGYTYVWHCHILEHEEHDMMRPLIIRPR